MKKNALKKIITGILLTSFALSIGITAMADENSSDAASNLSWRRCLVKEFQKPKDELANVFDRLLEKGKITQDTVDSINKYLIEKVKEKRELKLNIKEKNRQRFYKKGDLLTELVEQSIISEDIKEAIIEEQMELRQEKTRNALNNLVKEGIITEKDIENILDYMAERVSEREKELEELNNMTEEERREYFAQNVSKRMCILADMIENGVITEEQAEKIKEVLPMEKRNGYEKRLFSRS